MQEHKIISVTNQKGGVGKTTSVLNLGAALSGMLPVKETIKSEIAEKRRGRYHGKETSKGRKKIIVSTAAAGRGN